MRTSYLGCGCAIVVACFTSLWLANDTWLYTGLGYIDPWNYVGYGLYWSDPTYTYGHYKSSRLPWVLFIHAHYRIFGPELAAPLIQLECYVLSFLACALFLRRLFGNALALPVSLAFVLWTQNHGNGGAEYHNTIAGPLFLWCSYFVLRFSQDRLPLYWFSIPGSLFFALVVTNQLHLFAGPSLAAIMLIASVKSGRSIADVVKAVGWGLVGAFACFLLMGTINTLIGRDFWFLGPVIDMVNFLTVRGGNRWWKGWGAWVLNSSDIGAFAGMAIVSTLEILRLVRASTAVQNANWAVALHGIYLGQLLIWIAGQTVGQTFLDYSYFAYALWVPWFWAVAAVLAARVDTMPTFQTIALTALIGGASCLVLIYGADRYTMLLSMAAHSPAALTGGLVLCLYIAVGLAGYTGRVLAVAGAFLLIFPAVNLVGTQGNARYSVTECAFGADGYKALIAATRFADSYVKHPSEVFVWFDENEIPTATETCQKIRQIRYSYIGYSFVAIGHTYLGPPFPTVPISELSEQSLKEATTEGSIIAVLTSDESKVALIANRLSRLGAQVTRLDERHIDMKSVRFSIYLLRARMGPLTK